MQITLTDVAKSKLDEYLSEEPEETAVRILVEDDGKFGLSLDVKADDDATWELEGIPFVVEEQFKSALEGLRVDYLEQGASSGFSLTGGRAPKQGVVLRHEATPNPNAMKIVLAFNRADSSSTYESAADAPPVLAELFEIDGVESVFELQNFVTITCAEGTSWDAVLPKAKEILSRLEKPKQKSSRSYADLGPDATIDQKIEAFVRTDIAPFLQQDGGDIELVGFEGGDVKVRLVGACGTCPSSVMTLQMGVERRLKEEFEEIEKLVLV